MRSRFPMAVALLSLGLPLLPAAAAAQDGPALIRNGLQAFADFDNARALPLLRRGLNPAIGPQDSLWALGVQSLAQILFDEGQADQIPTWARFGMRLAPEMRFDSVNVIAEVLDVFTTARAAVAPSADDPLATTEWRWPSGDPGGNGRLQVQLPRLAVPVTAIVVGRGIIGPQGMSLPAGVYRIQLSATGYRPVEVTREVLPGVTTSLTFDLAPAQIIAEGTLPPAVRDEVLGRTAGLTVTRFGRAAVCAGGVLVGRDGLMLTSYRAIRGADQVDAVVGARRLSEGVQVAAWDVAADLAVLKLPVIRNDSTALAPIPPADAWVWLATRPDCADADVTATHVAARAGRPAGAVYLNDSLTGTPHGSPVVNSAGALVGLWDEPGRLIPADRARALLGTARTQVATRQLRTPAEVADAERHRYGSVRVQSGLAGATAEVTPLERWAQWPELSVTSPLPMLYAGPAGRYRLVLRVNGVERHATEFTIQAGVADALTVNPDAVAVVPPPGQVEAQDRGGGGFPWLIAALGGAGAGVVALLLMGGGEPTTGGITITVPNR